MSDLIIMQSVVVVIVVIIVLHAFADCQMSEHGV
jgi:hypothetical protein